MMVSESEAGTWGPTDLVITGGTVVLPDGAYPADVGIAGGRIAALAAPGCLAAAETLDARGLHIFPGVIDPHTHPGNLRPFEQDIAEETRAAAAGGITAILGTVKCTRMGQPFREVTTAEDVCSYHDVFPLARAAVEGRAHVDVGFSYVIMDARHAREIPDYAERHGVRSFKFFVGNAGPGPWSGRVGMPVFGNDGVHYLGFREAARAGGLAMVHAENQQVARGLQAELAAGPADLPAWARHSPDWVEAETIRRAACFAAATGARLYAVHITSGRGAAAVARAKAERPGRVFGETCPQYLVLHDRHPAGLLAKCAPPVHGLEDNEALWRALADGTIDCVGTDHIHQSRARKLVEGDVWRTNAGVPGHETLLPLLLSAGRLPLPRVAAVTSANAARAFGLWPRKGAIAVGCDADLTLVDLGRRRVVRAADFVTSADFTPYEGMELTGWPALALLHGRVIMQDGRPVGPPAGQYLWRDKECQT
jgi:dihydroorotase-like cyclic amidohydrolase